MSKAMQSTTKAEQAPPSYALDTSQPPTYDSLSSALRDDMSSLAIGDPHETISVPMISRVHEKSIHDLNPFSRKTGKITQTVAVRKMTREFYLKHYAKDAEGNFVGTASPAPDAALVFVPGKSTPEDLLRQVQEVAFKRQNIRGDGIGAFGHPVGGIDGGMCGFYLDMCFTDNCRWLLFLRREVLNRAVVLATLIIFANVVEQLCQSFDPRD
jgi:hypothetical protein